LEQEAMEQKRQEIIEAKQKKAEELQKRVENITRAREVRAMHYVLHMCNDWSTTLL
jgi:hypothetical protein